MHPHTAANSLRFVDRYGALDRSGDGQITDPAAPIVAATPAALLHEAAGHLPVYGVRAHPARQVARPVGLRWGGVTWWLSQGTTAADLEYLDDLIADGGHVEFRRRYGGWALGADVAIATSDGFDHPSRFWTPPPDDSGWSSGYGDAERNPFAAPDESGRVWHYPRCDLFEDGSTQAWPGGERRWWCPIERRQHADAWHAERVDEQQRREESNARERQRLAERRAQELSWALHEPALVAGHAARRNAVTHAVDLNDTHTVCARRGVWEPVCGATVRGVVLDDSLTPWADTDDRRRCRSCVATVERHARRRAAILRRAA